MLPSKLSNNSEVHLRVALKYAPNCTRWYTPSQLGCTLPSTLSRGKTLSISLDFMLPCKLSIQRLAELQTAGTGRREAGGIWRAVFGGRRVALAGGRW